MTVLTRGRRPRRRRERLNEPAVPARTRHVVTRGRGEHLREVRLLQQVGRRDEHRPHQCRCRRLVVGEFDAQVTRRLETGVADADRVPPHGQIAN